MAISVRVRTSYVHSGLPSGCLQRVFLHCRDGVEESIPRDDVLHYLLLRRVQHHPSQGKEIFIANFRILCFVFGVSSRKKSEDLEIKDTMLCVVVSDRGMHSSGLLPYSA